MPVRLQAERGGSIDTVPEDGGFGLVSWTGGALPELIAAADAGGCTVVSVWATDGLGGLVGHIVGAPDFVNQAWEVQHPSGLPLQPGAFLLVCVGTTGSVFADAQVVALYGHPGVLGAGILGHYSPQAATVEADRRAAEFDALNGPRAVIPALQPVVVVGQAGPGASGDYASRLPHDVVRAYVEAARAAGQLVILDLQIGWADPLAEVQALEEFLREPFVHLALDPEFMTRSKGEPPGAAIGTIDADTVEAVQAYLDAIAAARRLPPKMLVVHQFREDMVQLPPGGFASYPRVELTIDMDGFGPAQLKRDKYYRFARSDYAERGGLKLFLDWDTPLMSPAIVQGLQPPPDLVIYQ